MSEIDSYKHAVIGIVECPSTFEIVAGNNRHRLIPLYRLDEDAFDGDTIQGKQGDLLLGGGSGESAALRISIPEMIYFLTRDEWDEYEEPEELYLALWSLNDAYIFGDGYTKLGWTPKVSIDVWLAEQIIDFVLEEYPHDYGQFYGGEKLEHFEYKNTICRLPTEEEKDRW